MICEDGQSSLEGDGYTRVGFASGAGPEWVDRVARDPAVCPSERDTLVSRPARTRHLRETEKESAISIARSECHSE